MRKLSEYFVTLVDEVYQGCFSPGQVIGISPNLIPLTYRLPYKRESVKTYWESVDNRLLYKRESVNTYWESVARYALF